MNAKQIDLTYDLSTIKGSIILIEIDNYLQIKDIINPVSTLFISSDYDEIRQSYFYSQGVIVDSVYMAIRAIKAGLVQTEKINVNFLIHRIDLMDLDKPKKERGSLRAGLINTLTPRMLGNSNVIITSDTEEYRLRDIADYYVGLRKISG